MVVVQNIASPNVDPVTITHESVRGGDEDESALDLNRRDHAQFLLTMIAVFPLHCCLPNHSMGEWDVEFLPARNIAGLV